MSNIRGLGRSEVPERRRVRLGLLFGLVCSRLIEPTTPDGPLRFLGRDMPCTCLVKRATGHRCPGCGMTRGCVYLLRLSPRKSLASNLLSLPLLCYLLFVALGPANRNGRDNSKGQRATAYRIALP